MAKMWKGPCARLKAAYADSDIWAKLHRWAGRQRIYGDSDHEATIATIYRLSGGNGSYARHDLETITESHGDPYLLFFHGYARHAAVDSEFFALYARYLERLAEDIVLDGHSIVKKLGQAADAFLP